MLNYNRFIIKEPQVIYPNGRKRREAKKSRKKVTGKQWTKKNKLIKIFLFFAEVEEKSSSEEKEAKKQKEKRFSKKGKEENETEEKKN